MDDKVTWFEMNRTNAGSPCVTAYVENRPVYTHFIKNLADLIAWCTNFPNAKTILVADTKKNIPNVPDYDKTSLPTIIPFARQFPCGMKTQGRYAGGFPKGAIVHFTAGADDAEGTQRYCAQKGYTLLMIANDGTILQSHPLDSWGYHCGNKFAETHIGIEIVNAGKLEKQPNGKFKTWFGELLDESQVRYFPKTNGQVEGYYEKYTDEQIASLVKLLKFLATASNGYFQFSEVIGHDESCFICGDFGRKNDPGGALPWSMDEFRNKLARGEL